MICNLGDPMSLRHPVDTVCVAVCDAVFFSQQAAVEAIPPKTQHALRKETLRMLGCRMGFLRLVGSFKLYVSFAERLLFNGGLFQKRPMILRSLLIVATPWDAGWVWVIHTASYIRHHSILCYSTTFWHPSVPLHPSFRWHNRKKIPSKAHPLIIGHICGKGLEKKWKGLWQEICARYNTKYW